MDITPMHFSTTASVLSHFYAVINALTGEMIIIAHITTHMECLTILSLLQPKFRKPVVTCYSIKQKQFKILANTVTNYTFIVSCGYFQYSVTAIL